MQENNKYVYSSVLLPTANEGNVLQLSVILTTGGGGWQCILTCITGHMTKHHYKQLHRCLLSVGIRTAYR